MRSIRNLMAGGGFSGLLAVSLLLGGFVVITQLGSPSVALAQGDEDAQTGGEDQAALYFEIRHNGKPTDPNGWCTQ